MSGTYRLLGAHAHSACGDDELAVLVAIFDDGLAEDELAGATAFLLPRLAGLDRRGQHVTDPQRTRVLVVLLRVQPGAPAGSTAAGSGVTLDPGRLLARPEPRLADLGPEEVVRVPLRARLHERRRRDRVPTVEPRVRIADRAGERRDVPFLDGKALCDHYAPCPANSRPAST